MPGTFGRLLQLYRTKAGLSQEQLAERAGLSTNAISSLERGSRLAPHSATLDRLCAALSLDDRERAELEEVAKVARARRMQAQVQKHPDLPDEAILHNLPPELTSFVDREKEVLEIREFLQSRRLITVAGAGGAGKTRCAIKVARDVLGGFSDGVWFADFSSVSDPGLVPAVIGRVFNLKEEPTLPVLDTLLAYLKRKHLLLVLDNCEHVINEAGSIAAALLADCPNVHILATSRESLNVAGELPYRMPSLPVPEESELLSPQAMLRYGAVQLFSERAFAARSSFTLTAESVPHVADICRRLDGIPLAIELAAARINVLSPHDLAQKLGERFRLLTAGDRSALPRHRTMRALIDWSYDLLSDGERRLFRSSSIFADGFTLEMSTVVCGAGMLDEIEVLNLLSSLVDKSLVQAIVTEDVIRYQLLESMRQYAREKLRDAGEEEAVAYAHAHAFTELAQQLDDAWEITSDSEWHALAEPELGNFREALSWAFGTCGDALLGQRLVGALTKVWYAFGPAEGRRWLQTARARVSAETPTAILAALDASESELAMAFHLYKAARAAAERALAHYRGLADLRRIALTERLIGHCQIHLGEVGLGEALIRQFSSKAQALGVRKSAALALGVLANARAHADDIPEAQERYREALTAARFVGAEHYAAAMALGLAQAEFLGGNAAEALRVVEEALPTLHRFHDVRFVALARHKSTGYFIALGRYDEARSAAREALSYARDVQWAAGVAMVLEHLAAIAVSDPKGGAPNIEERRRAARILGHVDARLTALEIPRTYNDRPEYDAIITALRDALGEDELSRHMAMGSTWSEDQAVAEAMLI